VPGAGEPLGIPLLCLLMPVRRGGHVPASSVACPGATTTGGPKSVLAAREVVFE